MRKAVGLNAGIVERRGATDMRMTPSEIRHARAKGSMWLIRNYMHDLTEFFVNHDEGRFSRMVVDQGKGLATASPAGWAQHIVNCTTGEAVEFYRCELEPIYDQLVAWKLPTTMAVK